MSYIDEACSVLERPSAPLESKGSFWMEEPPKLDTTGAVIAGGMWPHQLAFWKLDSFIKVLVGGYGAGKTLIGSKRIISSALINAPYPVAAISPTFSIAQQTTIATLLNLLAGKQTLLGRAFGWRFVRNPVPKFTIRYYGIEATILVYSGDKPESLRGPNLAAAWIDEPFLQDISVYQQMIARIRAPGAKKSELFLTGTPEELNWGYDLCIGELKDKHSVGVIHAGTYENKALSDAYVDRLRGAFDGKAGNAYIDGQFVSLSEGAVYYGFDRMLNVVSPDLTTLPSQTLPCGITVPKYADFGAGMDFNVNPMAATIFYKRGDHLHYFDEIELPNADTEFMCSTLRDRYGDELRDIYPDATGTARKTSSPGGKSDFDYIRQAGYIIHARHENPKRRDRYNACNAKLKSHKGTATITIDPRCKKLIKYLSLYNYKDMLKQESMSHLLDAFGYPVSQLFPVDRSIAQRVVLHGA